MCDHDSGLRPGRVHTDRPSFMFPPHCEDAQPLKRAEATKVGMEWTFAGGYNRTNDGPPAVGDWCVAGFGGST